MGCLSIPELILRLTRRDVCLRLMIKAADDSFLVMSWLGPSSVAIMMAGSRCQIYWFWFRKM